jgi:signal transduction histidine kinase/CheY-like chemotaxis protein/Na+-transporting methylmalonyl-CoA/oxaloacetate decarboxylase gamma subunit
MTPNNQPPRQSLRYKFVLLFGLSSVLPLLLFLFVLDRYGLIQERMVLVILGMTLILAVLGFLFFLRVVRQLNILVRNFARVERGELAELGKEQETAELSEMARIADAFNRTLGELKDHTRELEGLVNKLSTLSEMTELVSRIPDINEVLQLVLKRTMAAVNAKIGSIMILDDESQTLRIAAAQGLDDSVISNTTIRVGEEIAGKVVQTGEPVLVENLEKDARFHKANDPKYETSSFISMPLRAHWRILGVLNLAKKGDKRAFSESDMNFLTTLLGHIGFALHNARLLQQAKDSAIRLQQAYNQQSQQLDQARQQVIQSDKLSALGQLIAGVAHELNNPLTTVIGRAEIMLGQTEDEKTVRNLEQILTQGQRAAKIVKNLLSFARETSPEKQLSDINKILNNVLEIMEYDFRVSNIEVKAQLDPELPQTMADANQMQQVFVNIVNNAQQAMKEKDKPGGLTVRTTHHADRLRVEFTDTGPGIPLDQQEHILEPFYTTKSESKGTGLGLSISYGIVKAHGGNIEFRSSEGEGSTFVVDLPIVEEPTAPSVEETHEIDLAKLDIQKVLVIDDEEGINELITEILTGEGCEVVTVTNGELALEKIEAEVYDLIVCDLRMPGMDGTEVYNQVEQTKPELAGRFLFLTGDISDETREFLERMAKPHLMKPFTRETFMEAVERACTQMS